MWTLYLCIATFVLLLLVAALLIYRGGRSRETADTIRALARLDDSVQAMRGQNSAEHYYFGQILRWIADEIRRIVERLGFLARKDAPEPPLPPTVKPEKDKML